MPFVSLVCIGIIITFTAYIRDYHQQAQRIWVIASLAILAFCGFIMHPAPNNTHTYFKNHPLMAQLGIQPEDSAFFIENNSTNTVFPLAVYNHIPHASRYPSNWFVSDALVKLDKHDLLYIQNLLAETFYEDIVKYKPEVLLLLNDEYYAGYLTILSEHPKIKMALHLYNEPTQFETDLLYFNKNTEGIKHNKQKYNLYRLKKLPHS
jgi:hypothetical protein